MVRKLNQPKCSAGLGKGIHSQSISHFFISFSSSFLLCWTVSYCVLLPVVELACEHCIQRGQSFIFWKGDRCKRRHVQSYIHRLDNLYRVVSIYLGHEIDFGNTFFFIRSASAPLSTYYLCTCTSPVTHPKEICRIRLFRTK